MEPFLKTVARHYRDKILSQTGAACPVGASLGLSRYLFCFPSRRSGLFFSRYLQEAFSEGQSSLQTCCVPTMTTINELFGKFSTRHVIDRTTLLFHLFQQYDRLSTRRERETFDQFVFWGDMLLSDFDDVDRYLVDANMLFANVKDLKEIEARFSSLTPEQIEIIRTFWQNFRPEQFAAEGDKREVFSQTWSMLAELYRAFKADLAKDNLAYAGMMEREVVESILADSADKWLSQLPFDKVVFVGLTAITEVDRRLMSRLKLHDRAEFCWDYADPRLRPDESMATSAAYFSRTNLSDFSNELTDQELTAGLVPEAEREVKLFSVSSGVGQTQLANRVLSHWQKTLPGFDPLRTAVVLPDEKLLLPMLYAVPRSFSTFNVTMGYSLKSTPVAALISKLALLQQGWRQHDRTFYFRQVLPVLSHPYVKALDAAGTKRLADQIVEGNLYRVPLSLFPAEGSLQTLFRPVSTAAEALDYLLSVLQLLTARAAQDVIVPDPDEVDALDGQTEIGFDFEPKAFADTDYEFIYHYQKTVIELSKQVRSSRVEFQSKTLFALLEKLVAGVSVPFSGEPLNGLQLMGVLETRSLDFDNVIILSMNEGTFPAKPSVNSFVPLSLRDAFGMPTQKHRDSIFAYHFYRLISRAKRLYMVYDSRTDGTQTGEESRYVKQLRYLMGHDSLRPEILSSDIQLHNPEPIVVHKTPEVMRELSKCLEGVGTRRLSASMLKRYIECPMRFYLSFVRELGEDDELSEGVDAIAFGDILHHAMKSLYLEAEGKDVQADVLRDYIAHPERKILPHVLQAFSEVLHVERLEGYNRLIAEIVTDYVVETLRQDLRSCPFRYLSGESVQTLILPVRDDLRVRFICIYDRLDQPLSLGGTVRIVDYKTGNSSSGKKLSFPSVEDLFLPDGKGSPEAFQVMLYSLLIQYATPRDLNAFHLTEVPQRVAPHLYFVRDFRSRSSVSTALHLGTEKNGVDITDFSTCQAEFHKRLNALFTEIFDPKVPFTQCQDSRHCERCPFADFCRRV